MPDRVRRPPSGSIKRRILLANGIVLVLMIGGSHLATYLHWRGQLRQFAEAQGWSIASVSTQRIYREFCTGDIDGIRDLMRTVVAEDAVHSMRITNQVGLVLISANRAEEHTLRIPLSAQVRQGRRDVGTPTRLGHRDESLEFFVPIPRDDNCRQCHYPTQPEMAVVHMTMTTARLADIVHVSSIQVILITVLTVGLLFLALMLLFRRAVDRPVGEIVTVMQRAKAGDLDVRTPVRRPDEFGIIAAELNHMLEQLGGAREQVRQLHQQQLDRQGRLATIGNLASAVAHEIKNPLAGIRGGMEVLEQGLAPGDERREITRAIVDEVDRINRMVRDLLSYSRRPNPETVPAGVCDLLDDVISQARQLPDAPKVQIVHEARCACRVAVDYQLIKQAFLNIIQNAFDAMPQGGTLTLICDQAEGMALIRFHDTGGGISPEAAVRVMQPFYTTRHRGTGLGLPIALSIVEAHDGVITFDTEPGRGTTFTVHLPLIAKKEQSVS